MQDLSEASGQAASMPFSDERTWHCPGIPRSRKILTGVGAIAAAILFFFLALWQGATMLVSTLIGIVFIGGFFWYLRDVAPTPFTIALDTAGVTRTPHGGEPAHIAWTQLAKVKEERFKSGKPISLTVYKRVGERGLHRAFVVYRDDMNGFDRFREVLRSGVPEGLPWLVETVHE